jgi:hypothetical protein
MTGVSATKPPGMRRETQSVPVLSFLANIL